MCRSQKKLKPAANLEYLVLMSNQYWYMDQKYWERLKQLHLNYKHITGASKYK